MREDLIWSESTVKVSDLKEYEHNIREYSMSDLDIMKKSVKQYGVIEPLSVSKDLVIINGHLRLNALLELGIKEVVVTMPDQELTEEEHQELYLRLNRNIAGVNDYSILREHFTPEDLSAGGFSDVEIEDITISPDDISVDDKPKVFGYDLVYETEEQKELAEELLSRLRDTSSEEESVERALISFIKQKING
jgi:hypothetical protein